MADKLCNDGSRAPYVQYARSWMLIEASLASGEFLSTQDRVELLSDATVTINDAIDWPCRIAVRKRRGITTI